MFNFSTLEKAYTTILMELRKFFHNYSKDTEPDFVSVMTVEPQGGMARVD